MHFHRNFFIFNVEQSGFIYQRLVLFNYFEKIFNHLFRNFLKPGYGVADYLVVGFVGDFKGFVIGCHDHAIHGCDHDRINAFFKEIAVA